MAGCKTAWLSLHPDNIQSLPQQTAEGTVSSSYNTNNALDWNPPTMSEVHDTPVTNNHVMVVQIVLLSKSTYCLADFDLQYTVETSGSVSMWQLWD